MTEIEKPKRVRIYVDYIAGRRHLIPFIEDWKTLNNEEKKSAVAFLRKEEEKMWREDEEIKEKCRKFALDILHNMGYKGGDHE